MFIPTRHILKTVKYAITKTRYAHMSPKNGADMIAAAFKDEHNTNSYAMFPISAYHRPLKPIDGISNTKKMQIEAALRRRKSLNKEQARREIMSILA